MVAPATTTWLDPFLEGWRPGHGRTARGSRAGDRASTS